MVTFKFALLPSLLAFDENGILLQTQNKSTLKGQRLSSTTEIQDNLLLVWSRGPEDLSNGRHC
jgi:hypothetical protein